jgi:hypothetical protein
MPDEPEPQPDPESQGVQESQELQEAYRSLDPTIIAGIATGAGAALSGPLQALTEHYLEVQPETDPTPEIELPPGVNLDDD